MQTSKPKSTTPERSYTSSSRRVTELVSPFVSRPGHLGQVLDGVTGSPKVTALICTSFACSWEWIMSSPVDVYGLTQCVKSKLHVFVFLRLPRAAAFFNDKERKKKGCSYKGK